MKKKIMKVEKSQKKKTGTKTVNRQGVGYRFFTFNQWGHLAS